MEDRIVFTDGKIVQVVADRDYIKSLEKKVKDQADQLKYCADEIKRLKGELDKWHHNI